MKRILIIGAGPAGLTTAYYLLKNNKNDFEVIVLEKDNVVGGISRTIDFNGYRMDTGIHRFFSKSDEINKIWNEVLPLQSKPAYDELLLNKKRDYSNDGSDPENDEKSLLIKDRITRIFYGRKFYDYPVSLNFTTISNMGFFNIIKAGCSYLKATIIKLPEDSLENFYINRFGKVLYQMFFESYTEKVWGIHPSKISADWGAQRVKGLSISKVISDFFKKSLKLKKNNSSETSLIEQFVYPKLGAGQMFEEMKNEIEKLGGKVYLNTEVDKIIVSENKISKIICYQDGKEKEIDIDVLVSSMPIKNLMLGLKNTIVPEDIYNSAINLPYREFMSVGIVTDKLKLKNTTKIKTPMDIVPDSWIYVQEPDVKMGRLQIFNNWSPYIFKNKEDINKKVFISFEYFCSENDEYWNMSDDDFINFAIDEAEKIGLIDKKNVEEKIRVKIPKAYPAYFGTYDKIVDIIKYLDGFENLYCVGRNGQHRYNNMDHSMLTGIEAAKLILENNTCKDILWKVNTEKEYHEKK